MTRPIKFRAWDGERMKPVNTIGFSEGYVDTPKISGPMEDFVLMQFTGLLDKNGLQEIYEGDIIDSNGKIKGNIYEMDAGEADFIVQGFGDKNWGATYKEAVDRGCTDSQRYADKDELRELD